MNRVTVKTMKTLDWGKGDGLIPAIIQDAHTQSILMLGFMNEEALQKTLRTKNVWFYSRTKERLWMKGETSKNTLRLVDIETDCDQDTLLIYALPQGPTCHTGAYSCFGEKGKFTLSELYEIILDRKRKRPKHSYTTSLFKGGLKKICEKIEEESDEVIQAATKETKKRLTEETVDLIYHLFVLLAQKNITLEDVQREAARRRK